jgi:hypothetical protein
MIFVGRDPECDVRIDSPNVSRWHCCIVQFEGKLVIRDLGSTVGISWNGRRVEAAVLAPQDEVQIANLRYRFVPTGQDQDVAPVSPSDSQCAVDTRMGDSSPEVNGAAALNLPVNAAAGTPSTGDGH